MRIAESDCREALEIFEQGWPDGHRRIAEVQILSGLILLAADDAEGAEPILREAALTMGRKLEPNHYMIKRADSVLGSCLVLLGRFEDAEPLLLESYPRLRDALGDDHPVTGAALDRIIDLYDAWGKPEKSAAYR